MKSRMGSVSRVLCSWEVGSVFLFHYEVHMDWPGTEVGSTW